MENEELELLEEVIPENVEFTETNEEPEFNEQDYEEIKRNFLEMYTRAHTPFVKDKTPGRNDPCPCGSGKKYKKCCGKDKVDTYNNGQYRLERAGE